jgi:steroid 5-alpha reductase family enzyme
MVNFIENDEHFILVSLLITVCMQLSFFAIAYGLQIDKVTDFAGTTNFLLLATVTLWFGEDFSFPKIIGSLMVILWSLRLGAYLSYRIIVWGEDNRFDEMRSKFWSFLGFWIMQILWVFLTCLPVVYFNSLDSPDSVNTLASIGISMFSIGLIIEAWADYSKFNHKLNGEKWCTSGLWKYSRHPNYFGNILLWFGIFVFCYSYEVPLWTVIGPLWTTFLLLFVSGIPLLEASADKKYGNDSEYLQYKSNTSVLIPWFNSSK